MISKNDCLTLLVKLDDAGVANTNRHIRQLMSSKEPPIEVLKFIAENKGIDACSFFEMLRKKHNEKKSKLYLNILEGQDNIEEVIITLNCFLTQVLLYGKKLDNKETFYRQVRANEITKVLNEYLSDGIYENCFKLLNVIKSDLLVLEYLEGKREITK